MDTIRFPTNYSVLLSGPPGVGKFEFLLTQVKQALQAGERVVFVTLDMHPTEIRARARELGLDLDGVDVESFIFVDCYGATASERSEAVAGKRTYQISSFSNLEGIGMAVSRAAQDLGTPVRIYFYSISTLFLHNSTQAIAKFFQIVTSRVKTSMGFVMYAVQDGVHEPLTMNLLRSLVDGVVEMRFTESMDRELRLHHMRGYRTDATWRPFDGMPLAVGGGP